MLYIGSATSISRYMLGEAEKGERKRRLGRGGRGGGRGGGEEVEEEGRG